MQLEAIPVGRDPPAEVNVIVEVPVHGAPIKYEMDEAGGDAKILAVPAARLTQRYDPLASYTDLPEITTRQVERFFQHYKDLEPGKWVRTLGWGDAGEARDYIARAIERAKRRAGTGALP